MASLIFKHKYSLLETLYTIKSHDLLLKLLPNIDDEIDVRVPFRSGTIVHVTMTRNGIYCFDKHGSAYKFLALPMETIVAIMTQLKNNI